MEHEIVEVDRVECRLVAHRWLYAEEDSARIDAHWAKRKAGSPAMYDGPVLLACRAELIPGEGGARVLRLDAFETRFSRFLAWREFGWPDKSVFNCFAAPAVRSSDGAWLVGEMGPDQSTAGRRYFPAGTPDPSDIIDGARVDLLGNLRRELLEETGLSATEGSEADGWTLIFDHQRIACIKRIDWPAPAAALQARVRGFLAAETAPELSDVHMLASGPHDDPRLPGFVRAFLARAARMG
jgi:8-oxo-dGTP pyrophosphatase MutT (NUDIX family)